MKRWTKGLNTTEQEERYLGVTASGDKVYDRHNSHFHEEGGLDLELLRKAFLKIYLKGESFSRKVVKFDYNIGFTTCVEVDNNDTIVMVKRSGRKGETPMVKGRKPEKCSEMTVILKRIGYMKYILITAFIGGKSTREPWDPSIKEKEEYEEAVKFWSTHALLYDETLIES